MRGFTEINVGKVEIVSKYSYILHQVNPEDIIECLEFFKNSTRGLKDVAYQNMIDSEIDQTESMLHTLMPRRVAR